MKRVGELDHITELRDSQRKNHEDLRKQRLDEFMKVSDSIDGSTLVLNACELLKGKVFYVVMRMH